MRNSWRDAVVKKVLKDAKSQVEVRSRFAKGENVCHKRREQTKEWQEIDKIRKSLVLSLKVFEDSSPLIQEASSALKAKGGGSHIFKPWWVVPREVVVDQY